MRRISLMLVIAACGSAGLRDRARPATPPSEARPTSENAAASPDAGAGGDAAPQQTRIEADAAIEIAPGTYLIPAERPPEPASVLDYAGHRSHTVRQASDLALPAGDPPGSEWAPALDELGRVFARQASGDLLRARVGADREIPTLDDDPEATRMTAIVDPQSGDLLALFRRSLVVDGLPHRVDCVDPRPCCPCRPVYETTRYRIDVQARYRVAPGGRLLEIVNLTPRAEPLRTMRDDD